jgi:hypothetical protein
MFGPWENGVGLNVPNPLPPGCRKRTGGDDEWRI